MNSFNSKPLLNPNPLFFSISKSSPSISSPNPRPLKSSPHTRLIIKSEIEIRVCVNRSCRKQGSRQTLEILSDLAPADISVNSAGCLGGCGAGPNLVVLPDCVRIGHCGTAARASEILSEICRSSGRSFDPAKNLEALALRKKGEGEMEKGNLSEAEVFLSQAIDLKPSGGLHIIYKSRSAARLAMGNNSSALEDAKEASRIAPRYPQAYICQGDAFLAMEEYDAAENAYSSALLVDPAIRRSKSFKARVAKLQEKLSITDVSS
ncbi:tetratricopeptide repeat (TPR)-containing protein [Tasmannia lanceolata]|uniref:tetratricopeptide repeat (TPR)-containing protein n=1 Tax=Tasmannia lanceolata TaxID=3420 RepID=UPI0040635B43